MEIIQRLYDNHGRVINYLRLAVTDRCNLRCFYCMPEHGIKFVRKAELLSYEEMERLVRLLGSMGIEKVRITGGEPFVRQGMIGFLEKLAAINTIKDYHITTNGTFTHSYIPQFHALRIKSVNLSLDSLDPKRFFEITRRDVFHQVMDVFHALLAHDIEVKLNMVVMNGRNIDDIIPMIELTRAYPVSVRFIEEMPFNGTEGLGNQDFWPAKMILDHITSHYSDVLKLPDADFSTSTNYQIAGYKGSFGIIAAFTRSFCGTCNRIRITPQGMLKTCLYDNGKLDIRELLRKGTSDEFLQRALLEAFQSREKDGFEAEAKRTPVSESMATIGG